MQVFNVVALVSETPPKLLEATFQGCRRKEHVYGQPVVYMYMYIMQD